MENDISHNIEVCRHLEIRVYMQFYFVKDAMEIFGNLSVEILLGSKMTWLDWIFNETSDQLRESFSQSIYISSSLRSKDNYSF